jgi:exodeoxyribonuclease III
MKIATFNVNGVNGRLPVLLRWLEEAKPDAVCLQELKAPQDMFWDYFRNAYGRDAGLRIDHLLLSPKIAKRLVAGGVDRDNRGWEKASDHAPTWIELADDGEARSNKSPGLR